MIELLKPLVKMMLSPMVHIPIMLIVSVLLVKIGCKKIGAFLLVVSISWYLMVSTSFLSIKLAKRMEEQYPPTHAEQILNYQPQVIVVLAGYYYDNDLLPLISRWPESSLKRLMHAYLLHKETGVPIVVTGGAIKDTNTNHAYQAANFLKELGVKADDILTISEGKNTQQEALAVHKAGFSKIILVTTAIHMPRAVNEFRQLGMDVLASPTDHLGKISTTPIFHRPNAGSVRRTERVLYEYIGLIFQKLTYDSAQKFSLDQG